MIGSKCLAVVLVWCFSGWWSVEGSRVLVVVPIPSYSHQVVFRQFTQELVRRGHQVVVITTDPAFPPGQAPQNFTEIDVHNVSYNELRFKQFLETVTGNPGDYNKQIKTIYELIVDGFLEQMRTKEVRELLEDKNQQFDLVVVEASVPQALIWSHVYRVPSILMSSYGIFDEMYEDLGTPTHPIIYPDIARTGRYNLSPWELVEILYDRVNFHRILKSLYRRQGLMNREVFGEEIPLLQELRNNVEMYFVNMHPVWEGFRPMPLSVVHLGGLVCEPRKDLPKELKTLMDSSKQGVIYMSFGTNVNPSHVPPERMAVFARVFATLPYDVFWKWKDAPRGFSNNIRTFSWLPQRDILRHEKLVLFITQGGLQSTDEALSAGVPLLGIPMMADQWINVENYERLGVGKRLDLNTLTEAQLREVIETLINDKSYRDNSARLARQMEDRPQSAAARAVYFAERVIRLRGRGFPTPSSPLTWDDIIDTLFIAFLIIPVIFIFLAIVFAKLVLKVVSLCRKLSLRARGLSPLAG